MEDFAQYIRGWRPTTGARIDGRNPPYPSRRARACAHQLRRRQPQQRQRRRAPHRHLLRPRRRPGQSPRRRSHLRAQNPRPAQAPLAPHRRGRPGLRARPPARHRLRPPRRKILARSLTIVVKAGSRLPLRVTANTGNLALRVPEAAIPRAVATRLGLPITATSANLFGLPECTSAIGVREQLGDKLPLIVDGGPTGRTTPTTIVDLSGGGNSWMILREGAIPTHEIALTLQH